MKEDAPVRNTDPMSHPPHIQQQYLLNNFNPLRVLENFVSSNINLTLPGKYDPTLLSAEDIQQQSKLAYLPLKLPFDVPFNDMLAEAKQLRSYFIPHRSTERHKGWHCLMFHGLSSKQTLNHKAYNIPDEQAYYSWTDLAPLMPETVRFFRDIFGYSVYERVRVMLLEPGGYILPHIDMTEDYLGPINIALNNPIGCNFVMEGAGIIPFQPGTSNMLSLVRRHIVWNQSNEDRYHILVNGKRNMQSHWYNTIPLSYKTLFNMVERK